MMWCLFLYDTFPWQKGVKLTNVQIILVTDESWVSYLNYRFDQRLVPIGFHFQSYEMQLIFTITIAHNLSLIPAKSKDFA